MNNYISDSPFVSAHMYHLHENSQNCHTDCRFLTVLKGKIIVTLNSRKYLLEKDNSIYIPCDCPYELETLASSILLYVCFHPLFLLDTLGFDYKYIAYNSADEHVDAAHSFHQQLAALAAISLQYSRQNELLIHSRAYALLDSIYKSGLVKLKEDMPVNNKQRTKLQQLYDYVSNHYKHTISLSETAAFLDYTPQYLSNFIKKNLHITFADYVNQLRIEAALVFLKHTHESVTRIAGLCGFSNLGTFEKSFMESYNMKAEDYAAAFSKSDVSGNLIEIRDLSLALNYIYNYMNYTENISSYSNSTKLQNVIVSAEHISEIEANWNVLINLGKASDFERPAFRQQISNIQKEIPFRYGRISECLSLTITHHSKDGSTYDFSKIFDVTDFLLRIHLKPFIDIDNKPFDIYQISSDKWDNYRSFVDADNYDAFLSEMLTPFLNACVARYGFDELCTWKFELWRRYNPVQTSLEPISYYISRFQRIAAIFKHVDENLCLGGPGFNSFQDIGNFAQILSGFQDKTYTPDFISAYYFPISPSDKALSPLSLGYRIASTPNSMGAKITELNKLIEQYHFRDIPFYITEYTSYMFSTNYINDSAYPATFILSQSIENYGAVSGLGYWLASDLSLDRKFSASPFFGGNGLISKDSICKPSYYAFYLLNSLGHLLISKGEHYIVTSTEEGHVQVLVYYHSNIVEQHIFSDPQGENLLYYPNSAFEEQLPLEFQVTLNKLLPGHYNIKEISLDLNHGNVLNIWRQFDFIDNIRSADISYMRQLSHPSINNHIEEIEGSYILHTVLNPNEAKLYELELYY